MNTNQHASPPQTKLSHHLPKVATSQLADGDRKEMGQAEAERRLTAIEDRLDGIIDQLLALLEL
jgi:hypothetical protein